MSEYNYNVIKSTWGISIRILGDHTFSDDVPSQHYLINSNIWLDLQVKNFPLQETNSIIKGLKIACNRMSLEQYGPKHLIFTITDIVFDLCDFQKEGLMIAVWGWANQEFGLEPPNIKVFYVKEEHKYFFNTNELD